METYWVPGVNNLRQHGRWAFAEFTDVYWIQHDFKEKVEAEFNRMIDALLAERDAESESARRLARLGGSDPQAQPVLRRRARPE